MNDNCKRDSANELITIESVYIWWTFCRKKSDWNVFTHCLLATAAVYKLFRVGEHGTRVEFAFLFEMRNVDMTVWPVITDLLRVASVEIWDAHVLSALTLTVLSSALKSIHANQTIENPNFVLQLLVILCITF